MFELFLFCIYAIYGLFFITATNNNNNKSLNSSRNIRHWRRFSIASCSLPLVLLFLFTVSNSLFHVTLGMPHLLRSCGLHSKVCLAIFFLFCLRICSILLILLDLFFYWLLVRYFSKFRHWLIHFMIIIFLSCSSIYLRRFGVCWSTYW